MRLRSLLLCACFLMLGAGARGELDDARVKDIQALQTPQALIDYEASLEQRFTDPADRGEALHHLGLAWDGYGDQDEALLRANAAVALLEPLGNSIALVEALQERSYYLYATTGDQVSYCPDRERMVSIARTLDDPDVLVNSLVRRAFCFDRDHLALGLSDLEEALQIAVDYELDDDMLAMVANARGNLFRSVQLHDRAYSAYKDAYKLWARRGDVIDQFNMLHNLAGEAIQMGAWDLAKAHIDSMFAVDEAYGSANSDYEFFAWLNDAMLQLAQRDYAAAEVAIDKTLALADTTSERTFVHNALLISAEAYLMQGDLDSAQANLDEYLATVDPSRETAFAILQQLSSALQNNDVNGVLTAMVLLRASEAEERYSANSLRNQLLAAAHEQESERLRAEILERELAFRERDLELAAAQNTLARQQTIIASLGFLLVASIALWLARSLQINRKLAYTDYMTGIPNRGRIFKLGFALRDKLASQGTDLSVIMFDLDFFKSINDNFGHAIGDQVIIETVRAVSSHLRSDQIVGRLGGEEFLVLLPRLDKPAALKVAEALRKGVEQATCTYGGETVKDFTVSLGVATLVADDNFQQLVNRADMTLYLAKTGGRNRVEFAEHGTATTRTTPLTRREPR